MAAESDDRTQDRQIADILIEDIVEWRILPGAWIREREIAERFNVSHAPVREAFRHVANIGLINVVPWRGTHVIEVHRHTVNEVFEMWKAMFGVVCRLAATTLTEPQLAELRIRIAEYAELVTQTDNTFEHLAASNRVGAFIARHSGAGLAKDMLDRIALFARWQHHVIAQEYFSIEAGKESAELYRDLLAALVARDPDSADRRARALLRFLQVKTAAPLEDYLRRQSETATPPGKAKS
ncbi:MAG TPA: hypothetical protein DF715_04365 [Oceanicaulis sp.]|nr:hypothetical protein [Oceanicaulis sp.]